MKWRGAILAFATLALSGCNRVVYLIGDSLAQHAGFPLAQILSPANGYQLEMAGLPGLAPCDFLPRIATRLAQQPKPNVIVLESEGNVGGGPYTACMVDGAGNLLQHGTAAYDYRIYTDLRAIFVAAQNAGVPLIFVGGIPIHPNYGAAATDQYGNMELAEIARQGLPLVKVSYRTIAALSNPDGSYATYLPCNAEETAAGACLPNGTVLLRYLGDLIHFDPLCYIDPFGVYHDCNVFSAGATRMARAIAQDVYEAP